MEIKDLQKVTKLDLIISNSKGTQLAQSAYNPLDLPYMFLGIGRTNNYIENFNLGIPKAFSPQVYIIYLIFISF